MEKFASLTLERSLKGVQSSCCGLSGTFAVFFESVVLVSDMVGLQLRARQRKACGVCKFLVIHLLHVEAQTQIFESTIMTSWVFAQQASLTISAMGHKLCVMLTQDRQELEAVLQ